MANGCGNGQRHGKFRHAEMVGLHAHCANFYAPNLKKTLLSERVEFSFDKKLKDMGAVHVVPDGRNGPHHIIFGAAGSYPMDNYFLYAMAEHEAIHVDQSLKTPRWHTVNTVRDLIIFNGVVEAEAYGGQYFKYYRDIQMGLVSKKDIDHIGVSIPSLHRHMANAVGEKVGRFSADALTGLSTEILYMDPARRTIAEKKIFSNVSLGALKKTQAWYIRNILNEAKVDIGNGAPDQYATSNAEGIFFYKSMRDILCRPGAVHRQMFDKNLIDNIWDVTQGAMAKHTRRIDYLQKHADKNYLKTLSSDW